MLTSYVYVRIASLLEQSSVLADQTRCEQIPFGSALVPHIISRLPARYTASIRAAATGSFGINTTKLHSQLIAYTLTNQISGAFLEVGLPYLKAKLVPAVQEKLHHKTPDTTQTPPDAEDLEEEKEFLHRIRQEQLLPT